MTDPRIKTLKIKTGVVKRIAKEIVMYEKEVIKERARIEKMKEEGRDEYVLRKQEEVLQESVMIIPDCQRRLHIAHAELKHILVWFQNRRAKWRKQEKTAGRESPVQFSYLPLGGPGQQPVGTEQRIPLNGLPCYRPMSQLDQQIQMAASVQWPGLLVSSFPEFNPNGNMPWSAKQLSLYQAMMRLPGYPTPVSTGGGLFTSLPPGPDVAAVSPVCSSSSSSVDGACDSDKVDSRRNSISCLRLKARQFSLRLDEQSVTDHLHAEPPDGNLQTSSDLKTETDH